MQTKKVECPKCGTVHTVTQDDYRIIDGRFRCDANIGGLPCFEKTHVSWKEDEKK